MGEGGLEPFRAKRSNAGQRSDHTRSEKAWAESVPCLGQRGKRHEPEKADQGDDKGWTTLLFSLLLSLNVAAPPRLGSQTRAC